MRSLPTLPLNRRALAAASFGLMAMALLAASRLRLGLPSAPPSLPRLPALPQLPALPHFFDSAALARLGAEIDPAVVLLFVPACALMLAIVATALRLVFNNAGPDDAVPHARAIAHWQDE
jgi:hypothetical protein